MLRISVIKITIQEGYVYPLIRRHYNTLSEIKYERTGGNPTVFNDTKLIGLRRGKFKKCSIMKRIILIK